MHSCYAPLASRPFSFDERLETLDKVNERRRMVKEERDKEGTLAEEASLRFQSRRDAKCEQT